MRKNILVAPSILSADFGILKKEIQEVERAGADWLHIDVMDGVFVPNISIGPLVIDSVRPHTGLFFDTHLMIDDPERYIDQFAEAGSDMITFHIEACRSPEKVLRKIKAAGIKAGVSIKPGTPVSAVDKLIKQVDMVLVMTVEPGFGGQAFMRDMLAKIRDLRDRFKGHIQVDGGVNPDTAVHAVKAGADVLVAGTAVFGSDDYKKAVTSLREGKTHV